MGKKKKVKVSNWKWFSINSKLLSQYFEFIMIFIWLPLLILGILISIWTAVTQKGERSTFLLEVKADSQEMASQKLEKLLKNEIDEICIGGGKEVDKVYTPKCVAIHKQPDTWSCKCIVVCQEGLNPDYTFPIHKEFHLREIKP